MSAPFPFPTLRMLATLSPREADRLLALAEHSYRFHTGQNARHGLRRVAAYRRYLKLLPSLDQAKDWTAEHRKAPRQDLFRLGELRPTGWSYSLDCLVRETSVQGALIEVGWANGLPDEFMLTVQSTGMNKRCQVVRRTEGCLGVAFKAA